MAMKSCTAVFEEKTVASLKKYDKKTEQANFARIEYQKILDEIRF